MIRFTCSGCQTTLNVPDGMAGKAGKCPKCGVKVQVPGTSAGAVIDDYEIKKKRFGGGARVRYALSLIHI